MTLLQIAALTMGCMSIVQSYGFGGSNVYGRGMTENGAGLGNSIPKPYNFEVQSQGDGAMTHRSEMADSNGNVKGSYGYSDSQGLYRQVEYTAGAQGFQASVKTNEPGTDSKPQSPADVNMMVQAPPAGIQEKYSRSGFMVGGIGGVSGIGTYNGGISLFQEEMGRYGGMDGGSSGLFNGIGRSQKGKSIY